MGAKRQYLHQIDSQIVSSLTTPSAGFIGFSAKEGGLYQKISTGADEKLLVMVDIPIASSTVAGITTYASSEEVLVGIEENKSVTPESLFSTISLSYVPYYGAKDDINLGAFNLTGNVINAISYQINGVSLIDDTAMASSWNGVTTIAPSKNAVYDGFVQNQNTAAQTANMWINGSGKFDGSLQSATARFTTGAALNTIATSDSAGNLSWTTINYSIGGNALTSGYLPYWDGSKLANSPTYTDGSGRVSIGDIPRTLAFYNPKLSSALVGEGRDFALYRYVNSQSGVNINFVKSKGAAVNTFNAVGLNTYIGILQFFGADGTANTFGASFNVIVDGTVSSGVVPMRFTWNTVNQAGVSAERMALNSRGALLLGTSTDDTANLFQVYGSGYFYTNLIVNGLASTYARLTSTSSTGQLTAITDGTNGQVLKTNGAGVYTWYGITDAKLTYGSANTFSNDRDIVDKAYVDAVASGNLPKLPVDVATTGDVTLSGTQTIDTYVAGVGARVLVWKQTTTSQNGVYIVAAGAWTRATDLDTWAELYKAYVAVLNGSQTGSSFVCTIPSSGTLEVTDVTWVLYNVPTNILAGTGLTKTGNTIALNIATSGALGGIKIGAGITITDGVASVSTAYRADTWLPPNDHVATTVVAANGLSIIGQQISMSAPWTEVGYLTGITKAMIEAELIGAITSHFHAYEVPLTFSTGLNRTGNTITSTITQYTDALARGAISLTTTGNAGASTYSNTTGVLNIPTYSLSGLGYTGALDANNYVHPTGDGNLHVPATSTTNNGKVLTAGATAGALSWTTASAGTVVSVAMTVPTGLSISGTPITSSGTLALGLQTGYSIPTTVNQGYWSTAYNMRGNVYVGLAAGTLSTTWFSELEGIISPSLKTINSTTLSGSGDITITPFPGFGTNHTTAAYGDHTHSIYALLAGSTSQAFSVLDLSVSDCAISIQKTGTSLGFWNSTTSAWIATLATTGAFTASSLVLSGTITGVTTLSASGVITGSNFQLSDKRLKKNIETINFDNLDRVKWNQFTMKNDSTNTIRYGTLAQDLETILPQFVYTANDDMRTKSVNYIDLMIAKIAQMEEKIKKLEGSNNVSST